MITGRDGDRRVIAKITAAASTPARPTQTIHQRGADPIFGHRLAVHFLDALSVTFAKELKRWAYSSSTLANKNAFKPSVRPFHPDERRPIAGMRVRRVPHDLDTRGGQIMPMFQTGTSRGVGRIDIRHNGRRNDAAQFRQRDRAAVRRVRALASIGQVHSSPISVGFPFRIQSIQPWSS